MHPADVAMREITPLQEQVLRGLDRHEPRQAEAVARHADLWNWTRVDRGYARVALATTTARNVLGWLCVKGLAQRGGDGRFVWLVDRPADLPRGRARAHRTGPLSLPGTKWTKELDAE